MGVNAAGILNKLDSFENLIRSEEPSIFCLQETKAKKENQHWKKGQEKARNVWKLGPGR